MGAPTALPNFDLSHITLAVIAGGKGQRMGLPKAQLSLANESILKRLLRRTEWPGPTVLVTSPGAEQPPGAELFDREAIDPIAGQGPLRGLLTAIEISQTDMLVCIAVDMPAVTQPMIAYLAAALAGDHVALGVMYRVRSGGTTSLVQPFPVALQIDARKHVASKLAANELSVRGLAELAGFRLLEVPSHISASAWTNLNTPDDLANFEAHQLTGIPEEER